MLLCSVYNVYKVVQARKGNMLLALAMVKSHCLLTLVYLCYAVIIYRFHFIVHTALPICGTYRRSLSMVNFNCICLSLTQYICSHDMSLHHLCLSFRDYLSPSDIIGSYPHLVITGTGLAFGFLVVRQTFSLTIFLPIFRSYEINLVD